MGPKHQERSVVARDVGKGDGPAAVGAGPEERVERLPASRMGFRDQGSGSGFRVQGSGLSACLLAGTDRSHS